jgi:divalent metal cation (Fe/Co/Zn/Cd) transporter
MAVEAVRAVVLRAAGRAAGSAALAADAQNRVADVLASLGVVAGLFGVRYGYWWADSVAALVVAALIAVAAVQILRHSADELMDRAPAGVEAGLRRAIGGVNGVREVRSVRVRRSGGRLLGDARVSTRRTLSVEGAQSLTEQVQAAAERELPGMDLVLVVEGQLEQANLVERIHATAHRQAAFRDIHNVTVEQEDDGSLHLTLHAKLPPQLHLEEAERRSEELEAALRAELPGAHRVDIHLEPLEPDVVAGHDVTANRTELADRVRRIASRQPEVVRCRDVELSSREGRITAHVVVEMTPAVSLERAHLVEDELERQILLEVPELEDVVTRATSA